MRACSPRYSASPVLVSDLFHYVVVRSDLPRGIQAANIIHAAGESSPGNLHSGTHAVCLTVPSEEALREVADRLGAAQIPFVSIVEVDAPYTKQLMAIGCVPAGKEALKRCLSALPLLR
jgi:hypothetical protein